ncbi:MAG: radical SAM protein [Candidatus Paceibacterota bacterium]
MSHKKEVIQYESDCCENSLTLDHFCGNGKLLLKNKRSRCNSCGRPSYAEVWQSNDEPPRIYMRKYCGDCGVTSSRISSDAQFYFLPQAEQGSCCSPGTSCSPKPMGENAITASQLHTCTLVVEIVYDCNFTCSTCYADSPHTKSGRSKSYLSFADFKEQILSVLEKQGKIDILQLSGGEPTLHPNLLEILDWLKNETRVSDVLLNTNGSKLTDPLFIRSLKKNIPVGRFGVYLQYDGEGEEGQVELRAGDFRVSRGRTLEQCKEHEIPVALVMTVTHENKFDCASTLKRALADDNVRWVVYQPEFISGRNKPEKKLEISINVADVVHSVAKDSVMDLGSWMPLPCSHPNCGMVGFLVRNNGAWYPVSDFVDMNKFTPLIVNRMNFDVDDTLSACGCDDYNLGEYLEKFSISKQDIKMVFIKPFQDQRTWDQDRIDACCTHVLTPDGEVDSFCRYYGSK